MTDAQARNYIKLHPDEPLSELVERVKKMVILETWEGTSCQALDIIQGMFGEWPERID